MKYDTCLEFFQDLKNLKASQIEDAIDTFTNNDHDKYNRRVNAFVEYLKEGIVEAYSGYSNKKAGNEIHFFTDDDNEPNAVLELSERFGLVKNNSIEWVEIKITNTNPIDKRLLYFEVICSKFQRACNVLFLNKILAANLNKPIEAKSEEVKQVIKPQKAEKSLIDFIANVKDKEAFALDLKDTFNTESGIDFKIMIELLKEEEVFFYSQFAPFYRSIKEYFNRNLGSQTGLNDLYKHAGHEQELHAKRIIVITNKLKPLIIKHKIK